MQTEIFFVNNEPKVVYTAHTSFYKSTEWEEVYVQDRRYFIALAASCQAAHQHLVNRSLTLFTRVNQEELIDDLVTVYSKIIDMDRGDGINLMMLDPSEWGKFLENSMVQEGSLNV